MRTVLSPETSTRHYTEIKRIRQPSRRSWLIMEPGWIGEDGKFHKPVAWEIASEVPAKLEIAAQHGSQV